MFNNGGLSLSDIAAATGGNRNDGFGEGGGIWVLIILFALFGGFGNGNYRQLNDTIRDGFCNLKMEQKDQQIAQLTAALSDCNAAKLAQQTATQVVNQIRPPAVPAYPASNPCGMGNWSPQVLTGGNYNNGCSCCSMSTAA